jgi:hypothetical protein
MPILPMTCPMRIPDCIVPAESFISQHAFARASRPRVPRDGGKAEPNLLPARRFADSACVCPSTEPQSGITVKSREQKRPKSCKPVPNGDGKPVLSSVPFPGGLRAESQCVSLTSSPDRNSMGQKGVRWPTGRASCIHADETKCRSSALRQTYLKTRSGSIASRSES